MVVINGEDNVIYSGSVFEKEAFAAVAHFFNNRFVGHTDGKNVIA